MGVDCRAICKHARNSVTLYLVFVNRIRLAVFGDGPTQVDDWCTKEGGAPAVCCGANGDRWIFGISLFACVHLFFASCVRLTES